MEFSFPGTDLISPYLSTCLFSINISDENFSNLGLPRTTICLPRTHWHLSLLPLPFPGDVLQLFGHSSHFQAKGTDSCQQFGHCSPGFIWPSRCALPHFDFLVFTLSFCFNYFPSAPDWLKLIFGLKKKKKCGPKVNIWKYSTVVKPVSGVFRVFLIKET